MANTSNYNWETPDDTDLVKDGAAAIRSLGTAIDTTVFNNAGAAIAKSIVDAKGDLIVATAADTVARLAVGGTNGHVLTVDSSTASGLKYAAVPASDSMTLLSTTSMDTGTSTVTVSSISQDYKTLEIQILNPTWATGTAQLWLNIESSSSIQGAGSAMWNSGSDFGVSPTSGVNFNFTATGNSNTDAKVTGLVRIFNYTSSTAYKPVMFISGDNTRASFQGGVVATNTAVDQITINNQYSYNFNGGSILVYGIK